MWFSSPDQRGVAPVGPLPARPLHLVASSRPPARLHGLPVLPPRLPCPPSSSPPALPAPARPDPPLPHRLSMPPRTPTAYIYLSLLGTWITTRAKRYDNTPTVPAWPQPWSLPPTLPGPTSGPTLPPCFASAPAPVGPFPSVTHAHQARPTSSRALQSFAVRRLDRQRGRCSACDTIPF